MRPQVLQPLLFGAATTDAVLVPTEASNENFGAWTLIFVAQPNALVNNRRFFHRNTAGASNNILILTGTAGELRAQCAVASANDAVYDTNDAPLAVTGVPYFIAATADLNAAAGSRIRIFTGRNLGPWRESTTTVTTEAGGTTPEADSGNSIRLGNNSAATLVLTGMIWEFLYIKGALTLGQLAEWRTTRVPPSGTRVWYVMGQNGTGRVINLAGYGAHGVITGAKPVALTLPRRAA